MLPLKIFTLNICRTRRKGGWGCCGNTATTRTRMRPTRTPGSTVTTKRKMSSRWTNFSRFIKCNFILRIIQSTIPPTISSPQFETISQPSPAASISRRDPGELSQFARTPQELSRTQQEAPSASSSRSSTLSRPNPPPTLSVSRTSSGRSRKEENQEWDAKLLGKPGTHMKKCRSNIYLARQGRCM